MTPSSQSVRVFPEWIISSIMSWSYTRDFQPFYGQGCIGQITTLYQFVLLEIYSIVRDFTFPSNSILDRCLFSRLLALLFCQGATWDVKTDRFIVLYIYVSKSRLVWDAGKEKVRAGEWMVFGDCLFCLEFWLTVSLTRYLEFIFPSFCHFCPSFPDSPVPHDHAVDCCIPLQGFSFKTLSLGEPHFFNCHLYTA